MTMYEEEVIPFTINEDKCRIFKHSFSPISCIIEGKGQIVLLFSAD